MKIIQKAAVRKDDTYLVLLRSSQAIFFPLHWDFPGGKLEKGEDPKKGIEREVFEETSIKVKALYIEGTYNMKLKNIPHSFRVYAVEYISGDVVLSGEHSEYKWAKKDEILNLSTEPYIKKYFSDH